MWEELSAMGISIMDEEQSSILIASLLNSYNTHVSHLSASAHLMKQTNNVDTLKQYLLQEYDHQKLTSKSKNKSKNKDNVAYAAYLG